MLLNFLIALSITPHLSLSVRSAKIDTIVNDWEYTYGLSIKKDNCLFYCDFAQEREGGIRFANEELKFNSKYISARHLYKQSKNLNNQVFNFKYPLWRIFSVGGGLCYESFRNIRYTLYIGGKMPFLEFNCNTNFEDYHRLNIRASYSIKYLTLLGIYERCGDKTFYQFKIVCKKEFKL